MSTRFTLGMLLFSLVIGGFARALPTSSPRLAVAPAGAKWVADEDDNICGIRDLRKVSNPAKVDYDDLWDATPQIQAMKQKRIDPDSTEGLALRNQARTLITKTCELVRQVRGHCGVWKVIRNEDGRIVPDITAQVKARF
jgi:hypothetical protein